MLEKLKFWQNKSWEPKLSVAEEVWQRVMETIRQNEESDRLRLALELGLPTTTTTMKDIRQEQERILSNKA